MGITIRYLAYPHRGLESELAKQMENVFTAEDKVKSYTDAENGIITGPLKTPNIVKQHHNLGTELGIAGTPTLILENGQVLLGYIEPNQLLKVLERK